MDSISLLRQFKIGPFALFDIVISYVSVFLLAPLLTKLFHKVHLRISRAAWLWWTLPIAVLFHLAFRQNTPFMKLLFDPSSFYLPAILLIIMVLMGVKVVFDDNEKQPSQGSP